MINPTQEDIGRKVVYTGNHNGPLEEGIISSFNDHAVFVRYGNSVFGTATDRDDLEWQTDAPRQTASEDPAA